MTETHSRYRGRFAPSPTGPLHFGSLLAAMGSYLQARARQGEWLLRIEDLDPPREVAGATTQILHTLERYGFEWDGEVRYQSQRHDHYRAILAELIKNGLAYRCDCSRREISERASQQRCPANVYTGHCRLRQVSAHRQHAIRLLSEGDEVVFEDGIQGQVRQHVESEVGDFVLHRADGLFAYQLAVVVDDADQGVTEVVRGSDLLDSTPRQILLQTHLAYPVPDYLHLPVALNHAGQKLSKQNLAPAIHNDDALAQLWLALDFLGQSPPLALREGTLDDLWRWSIGHWQVAAIPRKLGVLAHDSFNPA